MSNFNCPQRNLPATAGPNTYYADFYNGDPRTRAELYRPGYPTYYDATVADRSYFNPTARPYTPANPYDLRIYRGVGAPGTPNIFPADFGPGYVNGYPGAVYANGYPYPSHGSSPRCETYPLTSPECAPYVDCRSEPTANSCRSCVIAKGGSGHCAKQICGDHTFYL